MLALGELRGAAAGEQAKAVPLENHPRRHRPLEDGGGRHGAAAPQLPDRVGERRLGEESGEAFGVQMGELGRGAAHPPERRGQRPGETLGEAPGVRRADHHQELAAGEPLAGLLHAVGHARLARLVRRTGDTIALLGHQVEVAAGTERPDGVGVGHRIAVPLAVRQVGVDEKARAAAFARPAQHLGERLGRRADPDQGVLTGLLGDHQGDPRQPRHGDLHCRRERSRELDRHTGRVEPVEHRPRHRGKLDAVVDDGEDPHPGRCDGRDPVECQFGGARAHTSPRRPSSSSATVRSRARRTASPASSASCRWSTFIA